MENKNYIENAICTQEQLTNLYSRKRVVSTKKVKRLCKIKVINIQDEKCKVKLKIRKKTYKERKLYMK